MGETNDGNALRSPSATRLKRRSSSVPQSSPRHSTKSLVADFAFSNPFQTGAEQVSSGATTTGGVAGPYDHDLPMRDPLANKMDLSSLPKEYLQAYPYPAFVLVVPIPLAEDTDENEYTQPQDQNLPFTRSSSNSLSSFTPIWSNEKWKHLSQGQDLLQCLDMTQARQFGDWISGARAAKLEQKADFEADAVQTFIGQGGSTSRKRAIQSISTSARNSLGDALATGDPETSARNMRHLEIDPTAAGYGYPRPPDGFWEPEHPPYEERSSRSDPLSSSDHDTGIGVQGEHPGPKSLTVSLVRPARVTLEMTKTTAPIYQHVPSGRLTKMTTHTFAIVTTTPRTALQLDTPDVVRIGENTPRPTNTSVAGESTPALDLDHPARPRTTLLANPSSPVKAITQILPLKASLTDPDDSQGLTPTDESMTIDFPTPSSKPPEVVPTNLSTTTLLPPAQPNRPLIFNRDGTVSRQRSGFAPGAMEAGRSLDVHVLLETTDWAKTGLGPRENWPQSLKSAVSLVMQYPHQCCLWWGKELTLIYNGPYSEAIHKHPVLFGMSGPKAWAEIWNQLGPLSEMVLAGTPVFKEDDFLLFRQLPHQGSGTFEVYHTWMWVPIAQEDGTNGGLWNATIDTTKKVLAERRLATVREMGERTSIARTLKEFDSAVIEILAANPRDVPFAALYHVEQPAADKQKTQQGTHTVNNRSDVSSLSSSNKVVLRLAGSVGIPEGHSSTPSTVTIHLQSRHRESRATAGSTAFTHNIPGSPTMSILSSLSGPPYRSSTPVSTSEDGTSLASKVLDQWPFQEALQSKRLVLVEDCLALIKDYPVMVWDELPNAAIVVPIANDSDDGVASAVLVIGLSIRRPFDEDYESFVHVLRLQLASGLAAVRSYEAERQRIEDLAALDRAKSLLFSNVSHELRTPLTLVAGPLDDLLGEMPDGPKKEMLVMARRNVRRLTRLVSTLMDVSRLEAGRLKGSFRLVNLGLITRDLAALFRGAIEKAKLRYIVEADLSPRDVFVDPEHWEKIVFNLIGNALKYTMHGFVHVQISYGPGEAVLSVKDSGVGIPATDISLVGERFHRVQSVSRSHEGTGIGLALIKELVKLHGGTLEIESMTAAESMDGSHGSIFRVRIPLGSEHLPPDAIESASSELTARTTYGQGIVDEAMQWNRDRESSSIDSSSDSGAGTSSDNASKSSSRGLDPSTLYFKKEDVVMLVDDSFDTRRYMRSIFAPFCNVVEARDGQEALEMCGKSVPDLIITDVMMPNLDGYGLLSALKLNKEYSMIPIIMLTARGGDEAKVEGLLAGADDYLGKPFNARELIARAHMQLQLGKKRRNLEDAFERRTAEMRTLSEYSPVGIFRSTEDGSVNYANSAWYEMSGFPLGEEVTNWGDYIDPLYRRAVQTMWEEVFTSSSPMQTAEWMFSNGRWVTAKIIRLDVVAGPALTGVLGCLTDITERKLHEETQKLRVIEAEQRRLEAEEAKRQQELLIDITSHEIRNPISSLMQCSSLVKTNLHSLQEQLEIAMNDKSGFKPTKQLLTTINEDLEALESIYQCGLTQERISNDVLSLGRIQLDMLQIYDVEVNLRSEAQKAISIFQNEARMKRIALSLKIGESIDRMGVNAIKADPVRLGQVVTNLLSNGIRFTSTSQVRKIELRWDLSFDPPLPGTCVMPRLPEPSPLLKDDMEVYLYVAVTDTGPGLTPKELDMLFQRFSQVSPKTHTIFGGSGLGLFVCRKITELMGGRIEVASEHGQGSTFRFFIKARTAQTQTRIREHDTGGSGSGGAGTATKRPPLKKRNTGKGAAGPKPHVLIVEDNLINQTVLMRQLKHVGLTCEVADNGQQALEKIRKVSSLVKPTEGQPFDCVVMDLEMPVMDGLTAVRHIRAEEAAGTLGSNLVIALTGNARQGQIDEARAAGMDDVVIKPYRLDDLLQKIEDMMRIRANQATKATESQAKSMDMDMEEA